MTASITDRGVQSGRATMQAAARALAVDRVTAEVVSAFDAAAIPAILLKGPSIARWLYPLGGRSYADTDLLVAARQYADAERVLTDLGFAQLLEGFAPFELDPDAVETTFVRRAEDGRGPGGVIDLHRNLPEIATSEDLLWATLSADLDRLTMCGVEARVLNRAGVAVHIVLHAVQHRLQLHTAEDLRRAVSTLSLDEWRAVARSAAALGIEDVLGFGLRQDIVRAGGSTGVHHNHAQRSCPGH